MGDMSMSKSYSNYMKSKAMQKQKFFCEMCHKQCRDDNGFKCHCDSEGHLRMMAIFKEDAFSIIGNNSTTFENGYLTLLSLKYGDSRVSANHVYQEYIKDPRHMHMNATRWDSLTAFVLNLGRSGKCVVEQGEREGDWYIRYLDLDPQKRNKVEEKQDRIRWESQQDDDQRKKFEESRKKMLQEAGGEVVTQMPTPLQRENPEDKNHKVDFSKMEPTKNQPKNNRPRSVLDEMMESELQAKRRRLEREIEEKERQLRMQDAQSESNGNPEESSVSSSDAGWLLEGIVVKILNSEILEGKLYKEKAEVLKVEADGDLATVRVLRSGTVLMIGQSDLETVIPSEGGAVLLLRSPFRGLTGEILKVNIEEYNVSVLLTVDSPELRGKILPSVPYEDVSRKCEKEDEADA